MSALLSVNLRRGAHLLSRRLVASPVGTATAVAKMSTTSVMKNKLRVENLLVLGSGLMGSGIAQVSAASGKFKTVVLQDVSQAQLDKAKASIEGSLLRIKKKDRKCCYLRGYAQLSLSLLLSASLDEKKILANITFSTEVKEKEVGSGLLVIEAVPEKLDLKQGIFQRLYEAYGSNERVILATNTSSLPCRDIGVHIKNKERFAGLHFFNPVAVMKLVEIVRVDDGTRDDVYEALVQYVKDIGKVGVTCKDTPGFIVNRLLIPYMFEAVKMFERGDASIQDIDTAMKLGAGYPMGPFELQDYTGLDTGKFISDGFVERDGRRIVDESPTTNRLVSEGKLGRKTGEGFYKYNK